MSIIFKKRIVNLALGFILSVFSLGAYSATGLITTLYVLADSKLVLVSAGGLDCSIQTSPSVPQGRVNSVLSMLSAARADGRQITMTCPSGVGITQLTVL